MCALRGQIELGDYAGEAGLATNSIFLCPFCKKNDPSSGKHYSVPFLPATPWSPARTFEGLFELARRPSRALDLPRALLSELQRCKDTVRYIARDVPGQRTPSKTADSNLDRAFVENAHFYTCP